ALPECAGDQAVGCKIDDAIGGEFRVLHRSLGGAAADEEIIVVSANYLRYTLQLRAGLVQRVVGEEISKGCDIMRFANARWQTAADLWAPRRGRVYRGCFGRCWRNEIRTWKWVGEADQRLAVR